MNGPLLISLAMLVPILLPEPQKKKPVILVMPQTTASMLNGNKVKTIEVTSEAAPARINTSIRFIWKKLIISPSPMRKIVTCRFWWNVAWPVLRFCWPDFSS